ncbi:MAG: DUF4281 domain-containing protein [Nannocystis sp.]|nr:ABA4-like family protein [Nannocystis sp.]MBA3548653.1 DUF4281 domain-containing protein [Nannocystis sp.]
MSLDLIFTVANGFALLGWLLLAFAPRWRFTHAAVVSGAMSLVLAALYSALLLRYYGSAGGGFSSLPDIVKLFSDPAMVLLGWVHYLAFDLFIGGWELRDAQRRGVPHLLLLPCLGLTLMFGPVGLLLYFGVRRLFGRDPVGG